MTHRVIPNPPLSIYLETGRRIKSTREAKRLTQAHLAAAVGMSRTSIANIERGHQKLLLHTLSAITNALGVTLQELLPPREVARAPLEHRLPSDVSAKERDWITRIVEKGARIP